MVRACGKMKRMPGRPARSSSRTMGTKSLPSAPRPCSQMTETSGLSLVSTVTCSSSSLMHASLFFLGAPGGAHGRIGIDEGTADQVDAVGDRGEDAVDDGLALGILQALEGFLDRFRLARQVQDQGRVVRR